MRSFIRSLIDKLYKVLCKELYKELLIPKIVFQPVKITSADSVPEIVLQPVKITSADSVPELVFQPVKITSADSAGQCQHSIAFSISIPESAQSRTGAKMALESLQMCGNPLSHPRTCLHFFGGDLWRGDLRP